jgi:hypothetical protein
MDDISLLVKLSLNGLVGWLFNFLLRKSRIFFLDSGPRYPLLGLLLLYLQFLLNSHLSTELQMFFSHVFLILLLLFIYFSFLDLFLVDILKKRRDSGLSIVLSLSLTVSDSLLNVCQQNLSLLLVLLFLTYLEVDVWEAHLVGTDFFDYLI